MKTLILILLLFPVVMYGQIFENFEDGNDTQNPQWYGNLDKFIVNDSKQLQLQDTSAGSAYLCVKQPIETQMEWLVWVRLKFSPSANNNLRIYLMSNKRDLENPLQGYYLQLGEAGSKDALELFRQDSATDVSVCRGREGSLAKAFTIRIKVLWNSTGRWEIFADHSGGNYFQKEAEGQDDTYDDGEYFGFDCKYTKSNRSKMYLDDIYLGSQIVDTVPPKLVSLKVISDSSLLINFSESIDSTSAKDTIHYKAIPSCGKILKHQLLYDGKSVELFFSNYFISATQYQLKVSGIKDLSGNMMKTDSLPFVFYKPKPHDVVINEIMADPVPSAGLPKYEYLELYNRTDFGIDMSGWQITIGSHTKTIDTFLLKAKRYLIVSGTKGASSFKPFGPVLAYSSFSLNNRGQTISLQDENGQTISQITYSDEWYRDDVKSKGGWSLEQINPVNFCSGSENWKASENSQGGTPGTQNSVFKDKIFYPKLSRFHILGQDSINVFFNQVMDSNSIYSRSLWQITPDVGNPDTILFDDSVPDLALLHFPAPFAGGKIYVLHISKKLKNCAGYAMEKDTTVNFGLPQHPDVKDIVINEVLFHPFTGGVDYLEIYNRADKIIDLSQIRLGYIRKSTSGPHDTLFYSLSNDQLLMFPSTYLVLTSSPEIVRQQYFTFSPEAFLKMGSFPNFNAEQGGILMEDKRGLVIDAFDYSDKMHFLLLKDTKGVSLERSHFDGETNDPENWHSAAQSVGYGTPGYRNSQFEPDTVFSDAITIDPAIFSPDGDGYQDQLQIKYNFSTEGNTVSVDIFNTQGYLIRHLVRHEYLGTQGSFLWDGLRDDGTKATAGIYILYFELFDMQGHISKYKKAVVLAQKLR